MKMMHSHAKFTQILKYHIVADHVTTTTTTTTDLTSGKALTTLEAACPSHRRWAPSIR
jgi:hypothetical protein